LGIRNLNHCDGYPNVYEKKGVEVKVLFLFLKCTTHLIPAREKSSTIEFEINHVVPFAKLKNHH